MTFEGEVGIIRNVIIGIGINVSQKETDFPEELSGIATSIAQACGLSDLSRAKLAGEVIKEVDKISVSWPSGKDSYLESYRNSCITLGKNVFVSNYATGETRNAFAVDINEDFSLKVRYDDGSIGNVISGEVSVRPSF